MKWQSWHKPAPEALAFIASPAFSHGRARYLHCYDAYEVYLYQRDPESPTHVRLWGSVPDCPETADAIRRAGSAIEAPHA